MPFNFSKRILELENYLSGKQAWIDIRMPYKTAQDEYSTLKILMV